MINQTFALLALCLLCTLVAKVENYGGLTPQQTIDSLKEEVAALEGKEDSASKTQLARLEVLLEINDTHDCSNWSFASFKTKIEDLSLKTKTKKEDIVNLLETNQKRLFDECQSTIRNAVQSGVDLLTPNQNKMALGIAAKVLAISRGNLDFSDSVLASGIAAYLKQSKLVGLVKSRRLFAMAWRQHIVEACYPVKNEVYEPCYPYRTIGTASRSKMDSFEKNWDVASRVCYAVDKSDNIQGLVYKQL